MDEFISCHVVKKTSFHGGTRFVSQLNYFFAKEVGAEEVLQIERRCLDAVDHGEEVFFSVNVCPSNPTSPPWSYHRFG